MNNKNEDYFFEEVKIHDRFFMKRKVYSTRTVQYVQYKYDYVLVQYISKADFIIIVLNTNFVFLF